MKGFHNKSNKHVNQIALRVENLEKSMDFYNNILGFEILNEDHKEVSLTADGIEPIIVLSQPRDIIKKIPKRTGLYHFALLLPDRSYLGSLLKNLKEKDYPIDGGADHNVSEAIYLRDPDGNGIEIYSDMDSTEWIWESNQVKMTTDFLDYSGLLSRAGGSNWNGVPKETIIGHIHLHVSDLEKAKDFYVDGLGFDVTASMANSAVFLSTAGYHHHIALNIWNGTDIEPLPDNSAGMEYYTILFPDEDSRKDSIDKIKEMKYELIEIDSDKFTKDPSGNLIKLIV